MRMNEAAPTVLAAVLAMALCSFLQCIINTRRRNRSKQTLMPFLAGGCAVLFAAVSLAFSQELFDGLAQVTMWRAEREQRTVMMNETLALLNFFLFGGYLVIRAVGCLLCAVIFRKKRFPRVTGIFYEYDEDYSGWFLKEQWISLRMLFKWFTIAGSVLCGLVAGYALARDWLQGKAYYFYFYPVLAQMVVGEIYCFLNGLTGQEYGHDVMGEDSVSQRISNFYRIREVLERTFPRELLSSTTGCEYETTKGTINLLEEMEQSGDCVEKLVSDFFRLNDAEGVYDTDYIKATLQLVKGENVVFFNPFYRDLGKYLILSFLNTLLAGKKCLILVGRRSAKEDMKAWIKDLLREYGKIHSLWRVKDLSARKPECEVGVLDFSQLYDLQVMDANREFLKETGFVFLSEPSLIVNTGQVGMEMLARQMVHMGEHPVYCISDRLVDGLVDTMSHLLQTEITEVVAPPVSRNIYTSMAWNADGDFLRQKLFGKQTQYLGNGIELAAVAVKNQIPLVSWFGETKVPIRDVKWIAGQYYPALCRYMNLPAQQQSIYDRIRFISNIWSVPEEREQFVIAEDEFVNIFGTMRTFLSRGTSQTFVNVLSENYLLRDYMRCNPQMLVTNPNAIPSLVPDYAKTERNTLIRLLLTMNCRPVSEKEILEEFRLIGVETEDAMHTLTSLLEKYARAMDAVFDIRTVEQNPDGDRIVTENLYSVVPEVFEGYFGEILKNARYICEDEKNETEYLDAKLIGHVTQTILPGQFVTYDGKYYVVKYISAKSGVVLRRASNLYNGRKYYRQIRDYIFAGSGENEILSTRVVMDMEVTQFLADFRVATSGYLEMNGNQDLRSARVIDFSEDPSADIFTRAYHNKAVLRILLPESDDRIRFTFCLLLSEIFRSAFPNAWQYLAVTAVMPEDVGGMLNYTVYGLHGAVDEAYVYIIEDSEIDLGLLDVVEKNLASLLELMADFLNWHFEKMREPAAKDPTVHTVEFPPRNRERQKKMWAKIKRIIHLSDEEKEKDVDIKSVEEAEEEPAPRPSRTEEPTPRPSGTEESAPHPSEAEEDDLPKPGPEEKKKERRTASMEDPGPGWEPEQEEDPDYAAIDGTDIFDTTGGSDMDLYLNDCFAELGITELEQSRYQEECYLKYGFEDIDERIRIEEVRQFLTLRGFNNNAYTKARRRETQTDTGIDFDAVNHCDFCGMPLSGVSYEKLNDGRVQCNECRASAISSVEEFKKLFYQTLPMMENFYGIEYRTPITVRTMDAGKIAKGFGSVYTPSTDVAPRVVGFARRDGGVFSLNVENGSPRLATIDTMVHEMTHIWQYINWNDAEIRRAYPEKWKQDIVYEGMAMWASVQYLYLIGEVSYAQQQELLTNAREDIYGVGFRMYCERYPLVKDFSLIRLSPFKEFPPL